MTPDSGKFSEKLEQLISLGMTNNNSKIPGSLDIIWFTFGRITDVTKFSQPRNRHIEALLTGIQLGSMISALETFQLGPPMIPLDVKADFTYFQYIWITSRLARRCTFSETFIYIVLAVAVRYETRPIRVGLIDTVKEDYVLQHLGNTFYAELLAAVLESSPFRKISRYDIAVTLRYIYLPSGYIKEDFNDALQANGILLFLKPSSGSS
ncbi:hypothetical protein F5050DRAFT_1712949 [Lentinula boryana]|uniref:Uncharacterized protein n=1 Tax=Lentinula boryana TaxID=40481 RepID=A0ABQ8QA09_9AGAR|nr:hypothetical protein F5050DRAFT_1712949 [Lentinula boryana]